MQPRRAPSLPLVAAALLAALAMSSPHPASAGTTADVLVLGAGVAGIKAAADLTAAGKSVIVLEARNRPYGRVDTVRPDGWPIPVERGAQWFHGDGQSNAVYTYAVSIGAAPTSTWAGDDPTTFAASASGTTSAVVPGATISRWNTLYNAFENSYLGTYRNAQDNPERMALQSAVDAYIAAKGLTGADRMGFLQRVDTNIVQEYAASPNKLNLDWFDNDNEILGSDFIAKGGYDQVFAPLYRTLKDVRLGAEVTRVAWSSTGVTVDATINGAKQTFTAKYAICTLPLGVLKAKQATLFPQGLSTAKKASISTLNMGLLNKVVLQFPSAFWTAVTRGKQWMDRVPLSWSGVQWTEFYSLYELNGAPVVVAFQAGDSAAAAEALSDEQLRDGAMATLRGMFGAATQDPVRFLVTRWSKDPYALGSYSYVGVGATGRARQNLAAAEGGGRVLFAGEACSTTYPGTVQGAWTTGKTAASTAAGALSRSARRMRLRGANAATAGAAEEEAVAAPLAEEAAAPPPVEEAAASPPAEEAVAPPPAEAVASGGE